MCVRTAVVGIAVHKVWGSAGLLSEGGMRLFVEQWYSDCGL